MSNVIKSDYVLLGEKFELETQVSAPKIDLTTSEDKRQNEHISLAQQIILEAQTKAQSIIAEGEAAVAISRDAMTKTLQKEAEETQAKAFETGNAEGYADGYEAGFKQGTEDAKAQNRAAGDALKEALEDFEAQWQQTMTESIDELKYLALEIAGKIINQRLNDNQGVYLNMIEAALDTFRTYSWVDIYVSEEDEGLATFIENSLAERLAKKSKYLKVREKADMPQGTCLVETDSGVVDASVNVQMDQITSLLQGE